MFIVRRVWLVTMSRARGRLPVFTPCIGYGMLVAALHNLAALSSSAWYDHAGVEYFVGASQAVGMRWLLHKATAVSALAAWLLTALSASAAALQPGRIVGTVRFCPGSLYA